jgi:DNA-binding LacI/PurR family transcriptional regulator
VFAANDSMAIGAIAAFQDAGRTVPGDLSVVGFDDIPIARHITPPLTSVHVDIDELGARGCQMLLDLVADPSGPRTARTVLPATLVVRASCGAHTADHHPLLRTTSSAGTAPRKPSSLRSRR